METDKSVLVPIPSLATHQRVYHDSLHPENLVFYYNPGIQELLLNNFLQILLNNTDLKHVSKLLLNSKTCKILKKNVTYWILLLHEEDQYISPCNHHCICYIYIHNLQMKLELLSGKVTWIPISSYPFSIFFSFVHQLSPLRVVNKIYIDFNFQNTALFCYTF